VIWVLRERRLPTDFFVFAETLCRAAAFPLRSGLLAFAVFFLRVGFFFAMPKSSTARNVAAKSFLSIGGWVEQRQPCIRV
jgi:hypothetical protein